MTRIQVFGPGCQKCKVLAERAEQAARELGIEFEIEKVTDLNAIIATGILTTPALAVNGTIKFYGHVPGVERIKELLS
jgi:small redox-active disulfide protein 2